MKKTRMEKGITLVALIITIVILLILAVVAINSIQNDGILSYSQNAAQDYNQSVKNDKTMLQDYLDFLKLNDLNSSILDGKGTETEPYVISSIEDLILFGYDVNQGNSYQGKYVKLEKDLDFNLDASYENASRKNYEIYGYEGNLKTALTSGEGFIPIGKNIINNVYVGKTYFAGTFDGNGKTISNLRINKENNIFYYTGLFTINYGEIKNLGIKDCNININPSDDPNNAMRCGTICGENYGKIDSCWSSGNVEVIWNYDTQGYIAGIVGMGKAGSIISNCYNKTNINAVKEGDTAFMAGGIVGHANQTNVNNCYNIGDISGEYNGEDSFNFRVGGVASSTTTANRCYNLGKIEGICPTGQPMVGGVAGYGGNVDYCCNIGEVTYEGTSAKFVGTLVGAIEGTLSNSSTLTNAQLNGIGRNWSSTPEPTKVNTVSEMPTVLEIVGNGFKADTNNINNGYPILSWQ